MLPKSAIAKGKELEFFVADLLRSSGIDSRAERSPGSGNGNRIKGDILTGCGWCLECKNTKNFSWSTAAAQVRREAMNHQQEAIIWKPPQRPMNDSVVVIGLTDFIELLKVKKNYTPKEDILDRWSVKHNLEVAVNALRKVIKDV
jgi:hypothetical protein